MRRWIETRLVRLTNLEVDSKNEFDAYERYVIFNKEIVDGRERMVTLQACAVRCLSVIIRCSCGL